MAKAKTSKSVDLIESINLQEKWALAQKGKHIAPRTDGQVRFLVQLNPETSPENYADDTIASAEEKINASPAPDNMKDGIRKFNKYEQVFTEEEIEKLTVGACRQWFEFIDAQKAERDGGKNRVQREKTRTQGFKIRMNG